MLLQRQQQTPPGSPQGQAPAALALLATLLEHSRVQAAATAFVTVLTDRLACARVSLGFVHQGQVRVQAISHSAHFGKKTNLTRALEGAMDEAWDQATAVMYPAAPGTPLQITRAHEALVRQHGTGTVYSIPLAAPGKFEAERFASTAQEWLLHLLTWSGVLPRTLRILLLTSGR